MCVSGPHASQALNPDIFAGNEFSKLDGKRVCVLSSTSKYSACTPVRETPSPIFYEATYRARVGDAPIPPSLDRFYSSTTTLTSREDRSRHIMT
eukprot:758011-Hanusia_phi.AAC.6